MKPMLVRKIEFLYVENISSVRIYSNNISTYSGNKRDPYVVFYFMSNLSPTGFTKLDSFQTLRNILLSKDFWKIRLGGIKVLIRENKMFKVGYHKCIGYKHVRNKSMYRN